MTTPQHIVCAVRGDPTSWSTIDHAIDLALKADARLTFLHVVTAEFVKHATIGPLSVVYNEMREMSEFMMMLVVDRAQQRGVEKTDYVLREGNLRKQLRDFTIETEAQVLVMGMPSESPGSNIFVAEDLQKFVAELAEAGHIQVVLVEPGSETD